MLLNTASSNIERTILRLPDIVYSDPYERDEIESMSRAKNIFFGLFEGPS